MPGSSHGLNVPETSHFPCGCHRHQGGACVPSASAIQRLAADAARSSRCSRRSQRTSRRRAVDHEHEASDASSPCTRVCTGRRVRPSTVMSPFVRPCSPPVRGRAVASHRRVVARAPGVDDPSLIEHRPSATTAARACKGVRLHRSLRLPDAHRRTIDGLAVTSVDRTLADLGAVVRPALVQSAVEAGGRRPTDHGATALRARGRPRPPGTQRDRRAPSRPRGMDALRAPARQCAGDRVRPAREARGPSRHLVYQHLGRGRRQALPDRRGLARA